MKQSSRFLFFEGLVCFFDNGQLSLESVPVGIQGIVEQGQHIRKMYVIPGVL
jgi:hypothetical protein